MDNAAHGEDIFYSDDELSDSEEIYQAPEYYPQSHNNFSLGRQRQNSSGTASPHSDQHLYNNQPTSYSTIDRPVTQLLGGLSLGGSFLETRARVHQPTKVLSYSSIAKKEPLLPQPQNIMKPKPVAFYKPEPKKAGGPSIKVSETALMAGYRFRASDPRRDPRYPGDQQAMVGPIPGDLDHDVIYNSLRNIFQTKGPVCFMFVHKSAVKDNDTGKVVKFGYVVFAEKGTAQKVIKDGSITFNGGIKINIQPMM